MLQMLRKGGTRHQSKTTESPSHKALKRIAFDVLDEMGFKFSEIKEEYEVEYQVNGRMRYVVDVVGIKTTAVGINDRKEYKIAIECGSTELSKLTALRKIFDEVIWINWGFVVKTYERWKRKYAVDIQNLLVDNSTLNKTVQYLEKRLEEETIDLRNQVSSLTSENKSLRSKLLAYQKVIGESCKSLEQH